MANRYPGRGFYEYHKQFSATAAAHFKKHNTKADWSIRNNKLFSNIFTNYRSNTRYLCQSVSHSPAFFPKLLHINSDSYTGQSKWMRTESDKQGRVKEYFDWKEICNHFNGNGGCYRTGCRHLHVCLKCHQKHPAIRCPKNHISASTSKKRPSPPPRKFK